MTPEQKEAVQASFVRIAPVASQLADVFYARLFILAPEVRPFFKGDMEAQGIKLMKTLQLAVKGLDDLDQLRPTLEQLARDHLTYGVRREHYDQVGNALLWTLRHGLNGDFTPQTEEAWRIAYRTLAGIMIDAAYPSRESTHA